MRPPPPRRLRSFLLLPVLLPVLLLAPHVPVARAEDEPPPPPLEDLLASEDWAERVAGLAQLAGRVGDEEAARAAIPFLEDPDWEVRIRAAEALGAIGTEPALRPLVRRAVDGEIAWIREAAIAGLTGRTDGAATELLDRRARAAREDERRARAVLALGRLARPEALRTLRPWLARKETRVVAAAARGVGDLVRRHPEIAEEALELLERVLRLRKQRKHFTAYAAAIDAVGGIDTPQARRVLVTEVIRQPDEDRYVLRRVARHLAAMNPEWVGATVLDALPLAEEPHLRARLACLAGAASCRPLIPLLRRLLGSASDVSVRVEAVRSLGLLGDEAVVPDLRKRLEDDASEVRLEAILALARVMEPAAFRGLRDAIAALEDPDASRQFVVALSDHGDPDAIPLLASFVRDDDWRVATAAIVTIGTLGVAQDAPLVERSLEHRDWKRRAAAYEALGRLRAASAIPRLADGLEDADPVVRGVCHANLQILSREELAPDAKLWRAWYREHGEDLVLRKRSRMTDEERAREDEERARTRYAHERYEFERRRGVEILQKARIIVVTGAWDHVEVVLGHLDIPYTLLRAQQLKTAGLNPNQVVLVNCEGNVDKGSQERLRWFVNVGGYLMTTDWALTKTVEPCFPGFMRQFSGSTTGNDVVVVENAAPGHPFTRGIFEDVPALQWWLEVRAFPIEVTRPTRCQVIVDSAEMRQRYGSSPCATVFRWGLGKVQHSVSHFQLQEEGMQQASRPRDRMVFAADHLGLDLAQIRRLAAEGAFDRRLNEETMRAIAPDYSMFRLIVNVVQEKEDWVEDL